MTMSPQQKAAETMKNRRQMAAILAELDDMRKQVAAMQRIFPKMERILDDLLAKQDARPALQLVASPDETP